MSISKINSFLFLNILFVLLFVNNSYAQTDDTNDLESWNTIAIEYEPNKKLNLELLQQLRLKDDISEIDKYFTQFYGGYSIFKNFELGVGLRYIRENDTEGNLQGYENHFRFHLDASYKHKIDDFSIKYRLRYQNKNELGVSSSEGDYANQNIRFKTGIEYNFKNWKLDPKFSAEIFNHFETGEDSGFSKYRLAFGTDYNMKAFGKISLFYRIEKELNESFPETKNIIGLKYTYKFKNR